MSYTTVKRRNVIVAVNGDCVYEGVVNFSEFESRFFINSTNILSINDIEKEYFGPKFFGCCAQKSVVV